MAGAPAVQGEGRERRPHRAALECSARPHAQGSEWLFDAAIRPALAGREEEVGRAVDSLERRLTAFAAAVTRSARSLALARGGDALSALAAALVALAAPSASPPEEEVEDGEEGGRPGAGAGAEAE